MGDYEIHKDTRSRNRAPHSRWNSIHCLPTEGAIKEDFILAEMNNAVRYFSALFGTILIRSCARISPFGYGQGFATTIMIPKSRSLRQVTYILSSRMKLRTNGGGTLCCGAPTATVAQRRVCGLFGFAYTQKRDKTSSEKDLIKRARDNLKNPREI